MDLITWFIGFTALATAIIAWLTSRSAEAQKKAAHAQIILELRNDYASEKTGNSIRAIYRWKKVKGDNFFEWFGTEFPKFSKESDFGTRQSMPGPIPLQMLDQLHEIERQREALKETDEARRHCTQYFKKIAVLLDAKVVPKKIIKKAVHSSQVNFLFDILLPLEEAINKDFDQKEFDALKKL